MRGSVAAAAMMWPTEYDVPQSTIHAAFVRPPSGTGDPVRVARVVDARKLGNVQALRAAAVLLVVGVHLGNPNGFEKRYLQGGDVTSWAAVAGQSGVDLFFVISGLIMTLTTHRSAHGLSAARSFLARRVKRVYPIYWIVTIPVFGLFLLDPDLVNSSQANAPQPLQSFLILPQAGLPLVLVGWTLVYEMYFYVVFAAALAWPRHHFGGLIAGWAALTVVLAVAVRNSDLPTVIVVSNPILLEFALGVGVGFVLLRTRPRAPSAALGVGAALLVVVLIAAGLSGEQELAPWTRALAVGSCCALIVYGAVGLEERGTAVAPRIWQTLGDASYSIYLSHVLILAVIGRVVERLLPYEVLHLPILVAATVLTVAIGTGVYFLIERPLLRALGTRRHLAVTSAVAKG